MIGALRGALGFLTRLPIGHDRADFEVFSATPAAFPLAAYLIALPLAAVVALPLPGPIEAFALVVAVVLVTGVNHADGLADLGDAAVVHGDPAERRAVMTDTTVGVGAVLALGVGLVGLTMGGLALAELSASVAVAIVVAGEVGAKLAMATLVCLGQPSHEGFGATFLGQSTARDLLLPVLVAVPAIALGAVAGLDGVLTCAVAVAGAVAVARALRHWADTTLGGVSGDVIGAANELARVAALHLGVIVWTLS